MKNAKSLLLTSTFLSILCLTSCGSNRVDMSKWEFTPKDPSNLKIGILLPAEHSALEAAKNGFIEALKSNGFVDQNNITINYRNANGNESDLNTIAKDLIVSSDLTLGVGTSAAYALYSQSINAGIHNPILFTAVTDAVKGELVDSNENPGQYVTGTSDDNPVEAQIALLKEALPNASKVGIFYTQSEVNSKVQADKAKTKIEELGMTAEIQTCSGSVDLVQNIQVLASKVDAIYIPTDNNCSANITSIASNSNKKLLLVGEENQLIDGGGHLTLSVNYTELGKKTGLIAVDIIRKVKKPNEIPVTTMSQAECTLKYSLINCESAGITLPQSILDRGSVFTKD